jgi:hypothetical protein
MIECCASSQLIGDDSVIWPGQSPRDGGLDVSDTSLIGGIVVWNGFTGTSFD